MKTRKINKIKLALIILVLLLVFWITYKGLTNISNHNKNIENENNSDFINKNIVIQNENIMNNTNMQGNIEEIPDIKKNIIKNKQNNVVESNESEEKLKKDNQSESIEFNSTVAFIGDSRTQGFIMYNGLKDVQDYSYIGLMVDTAVTKKIVKTENGEKITLLQDMKNRNIKKVYIMLGVNELGWSYPQVFKLKYKELIDEIRKVQPNCNIYLQSIIPVTKSKDQSDSIYNNKKIAEFNKLIQEVASEKNVVYLDVASVLVNKEGYLPEEASIDGVHVDKEYCKKWLDYLKNNS